MPKLIFTDEELKAYFRDKVKHNFHEDMCKHATDMKVHSEGNYPKELIEERRPNESAEVKAYREKIYVPKTKPTFGKVLASLSKIRRSVDWAILHQSDQDKISKIAPDETLEQYCEYNFPFFTSVTNWVFQVLLKPYADDPNALVFVFPPSVDVEPNEFLKPFPIIFSSEDTLDFVQEDFAVLVNPLGSTFYVRGKQQKGESFYIVTTKDIQRWDQVDSKGTISLKVLYEHGLPELPVWRIGAIVNKTEGNNYYHESRLAAMLPDLNEAIREYSDLQAAKVLHIYPERYEYTNNACKECNGSGKKHVKINNLPCMVDCETCSGIGYVSISPYGKTLIKPSPNTVQANIPNPPIGYVLKDTKIVEIQSTSVDAHIYSALSSINFQFLEQTPLNQSGTAKEVDKDELNNTVNAIAEDIVRNMDNFYKFCAYYRYSTLYPIDYIDEFILPKINVPERYDLLSSVYLESQIKAAKENGLNPVIKNALEGEYAGKKFPTMPQIKDQLKLIYDLNPLANIDEDEKMSMLSNKGITLRTYVISCNIREFIQRAIDENKKFANLTLKEQKEIVEKYADELIQNEEEKQKKLLDPATETGLKPNGDIVDEQQPETALIGN